MSNPLTESALAIAVGPGFQNHGLGSLLFYKLCQAEKDCGARYMSLFTGINNHAQNIYKSAGFETKRFFAPAEAPHYTEEDVTREYHAGPEFPSMVGEAQRRLGRILSTEELKNKRYDRFRAFGFFSEK